MNKHPVIWFYLLAFGISWLGWMPAVLGSHAIAPFDAPSFQFLLILPAVAPALAAAVVTQQAYGRAHVEKLFQALFQWRVGVRWYLVALFAPLALLLLAQGLTKGFGLPVTWPALQGDLFSLALSAFVMSLFSNPWEEVGWRGFALPHLQKQYTAVTATFIVGVLWGLWHLPLFFWKGNPMSQHPFVPWFISTVAGAFLYTWLYNSTQGSLLLAALFHVALNTFGVVVNGISIPALALLYVVVAIALVLVFGHQNLARCERVRAG